MPQSASSSATWRLSSAQAIASGLPLNWRGISLPVPKGGAIASAGNADTEQLSKGYLADTIRREVVASPANPISRHWKSGLQ
jgi:hypothetical protein